MYKRYMNRRLTTTEKFFVLFLIPALVLSATFVFKPKLSYANDSIQVNFFWGEGCPHCAKVEPVINILKDKFPQIEFNNYEVYHYQDNALLLYQLYDQYKVPEEYRGGVPIVFIGNEYFMGDKPIIDNLENKIISELAAVENKENDNENSIPLISTKEEKSDIPDTASVSPKNDDLFNGNQSDIPAEKSYSLWAVAGAAVVDSINPCAIAVLLILLTVLMMGAGNKKRALYGGLAFTFSIYIAYFLFGLGLLQIIAVTHLADIIAKVVGVVALLIGLANIKDFIFYGGGGFVMEIPRKWRPTLKKILSGVTSPAGAFFAGFAVTLFELPCTGGPYFFVLGLLSQTPQLVNVLPTLLFYNLVFVFPLLFIVFAVYFGISSIECAEKWKEKNIRSLHLIAGVIMLALGIWIFFV